MRESRVLPTLVGSGGPTSSPLKANLLPLAGRKVLKYATFLAKFSHHSAHPGKNSEEDPLIMYSNCSR